MKTPMQELIDKIQSLKELDAVINPIDVITHIVEMQLPKEKKVISDAYINGAEDFTDLALNDKDKLMGVQYYKDNFES